MAACLCSLALAACPSQRAQPPDSGSSVQVGDAGLDGGPVAIPPDASDSACVPAKTYTAKAWPEADALFRQSDRWTGADAAYSVDLGNDRILWLFGDTFVSKTPGSGRAGAFFPHNTVGIQVGRDPSKATMTFYWGNAHGSPSSFFPNAEKNWFWPLHGVRLGSRLLLFLQEIAPVAGGLGFEAVGGVALAVDNPDAEPSQWAPRRLDEPAHPFGAILGMATLVDADWLLSVSLVEPGSHDAHLARWALADAQAGTLAVPQWWSGTWSTTATPKALWRAGAPELSVQRRCDGFATIQSPGFGGTTISIATSPTITGPWSGFTQVYRPPESDRANVLVYAAKSHPELTGAEYVVTYASNSTDFATLVNDLSLYFPRFVKIDGQ
ncbi:MAG TPA: hypothetical protein VGK67_28465 [Myxococcales bacterium]